MPLDSENEAMIRAFNAFDDSVFCGGISDQSLARFLDCLVMARIYFNSFAAHDPMKFRLSENIGVNPIGWTVTGLKLECPPGWLN